MELARTTPTRRYGHSTTFRDGAALRAIWMDDHQRELGRNPLEIGQIPGHDGRWPGLGQGAGGRPDVVDAAALQLVTKPSDDLRELDGDRVCCGEHDVRLGDVFLKPSPSSRLPSAPSAPARNSATVANDKARA